jgi:hypothetical protein
VEAFVALKGSVIASEAKQSSGFMTNRKFWIASSPCSSQ